MQGIEQVNVMIELNSLDNLLNHSKGELFLSKIFEQFFLKKPM